MGVAVIQDIEIIYKKGFEVSNVNTQSNFNENILIAVDSITKTFTATSLMSV